MVNNKKLLQPKEISELTGINKSTLNTYLKDEEMFPPAERGKNKYRYYTEDIIDILELFVLLKDGFQNGRATVKYNINEIKALFKESGVSKLVQLNKQNKLFDFLTQPVV